MPTTLCVSTMGVYIVGTTDAHKYKPSISPEQGRKHAIAMSVPKMKLVKQEKRKQDM